MAKTFVKGAVLAAMIAATGISATAAHAATATGTARAKILREITVTNTRDLQFATVISGANASTVVVGNDGARTCGANLTCTGTTTSANFDIQGTNNAVVTVSGPASVSLTDGATVPSTMTANLTYSSGAATGGALTLTQGPGSVGASFQVGGTLNIGANQTPGDYAGTFTVTVNY